MAVQLTSQARPSLEISLWPVRLRDCSAVMPQRASTPGSVTASSRLLVRVQKSRYVSPGKQRQVRH
jgi:hypothetical protein